MALIMADGLDLYSSTDEMTAGTGFYHESKNATFHATDGRFGGGCMKGTVKDEGYWFTHQFNPGDTVIFTGSYYHNGTGDCWLVWVANTATFQQCFGITHKIDGQIEAWERSGLVGTSAVGALPLNAWSRIEMKATIGNGTGTLYVNVNGVNVITATGLTNYRTSPADGVAHFRISGANGGWKWDDFVIMDGSGSEFNDFLGDIRIDTLIPASAGPDQDFTASAGSQIDCVDDALGSPNDDTDYIASKTVGHKSSFAMTDLTQEPTAIFGVVPRTRTKKSGPGVRTYKPYVERASAEADGATVGCAGSYSWRRHGVITEDPNTSSAWEAVGSLNSVRMGVEIVS